MFFFEYFYWQKLQQLMSAQDYNKKIQTTRKALVVLKKDIQHRDSQVLLNEPTYTIDAQINGQFREIDEEIQALKMLYQNIEANSKQIGLMQRQLDKRKQALNVNIQEKNKLRRMYDQSLGRKVPNTRAAQQAQNREKFQKEFNTQNMSKQDYLKLKEKQEDLQDEKITNLTGVVRQMKGGQREISEELTGQDKLLNQLEAGMDENTEQMSKVRRNMNKLLQGSSYWCLVTVILLEVAGIICNLLLWTV